MSCSQPVCSVRQTELQAGLACLHDADISVLVGHGCSVCVCVCVWLERCDIDRYWDTCLFCVQLAWLAWLTWQVIVISTPSMQSAEGSHATVHYSRLQCPFHCAGNAVRLAGRSDSLTALSCVWPTSRYCMRAIGGRVRSAVEASYLLQ
jgi:hypothetical protein